MKSLKFYEFSQNNSGGKFTVDDKLCHRLIIEASSEEEACSIAEDMGVYFNGCEDGIDCECCGDRWHTPIEFNVDRVKEWSISKYKTNDKRMIKEEFEKNCISELKEKYSGFEWLEEPRISRESEKSLYRIEGKLNLRSVEEYAQMLANEYGWTSPDCRIFYKNKKVKEVFSKKW